MRASARPAAPALFTDHPFLHGFDPGFLSEIGEGAEDRSWEPGEFLLREGAEADWFHLLLHGKVALELEAYEKPRLTIQTLGPGDVLGWSWLVPPHHWQLDARAVKPTRTLSLRAEVLRRVLERRPADAYRFLLRLLPVIATRVQNARLQILDVHGV
ncbi:MAG: cyclic nucleotide-binding domain-containing protein [Thermoplasmata archaeon]|nr:cyclic nucleotide-binding domain-containing protein [Thermoplasmata archaeon]